ncbi:protein translocase subunit secB [Sulfurivirga caldicuralii]|uniref:Protein-export protein SecB n=1 Tax=Sulfurivirga caldicuralii TaxID=364032 RepID=A0A1N6HJ02_9GAMM|nr:protein-export chaperone SecB [Sulfurivirga caldicuralii]SIO19625.1 protein translocase subunit secB [Sulfurivirga caldicuralii]
MSEATTQQPEQIFTINKIYTRNVSFESPNAPGIFTVEFQPQLEVDLNVSSEALEPEEGVFNVIVRVTATTRIDEHVAFLVEVEQAGIFQIKGFTDADINYLLGVHCPNILFPYAREAVSDLVIRGGFPPLLLEPVNFEAMYAEHVQQQQAEATQQ